MAGALVADALWNLIEPILLIRRPSREVGDRV